MRRSVFFLVPILLGLVAIWTGYSSAVNRRYEALNAVAGELLAGGSMGQTFVARYNDLSGIDVRIGTYGRQADPKRATLVMHLRANPSSPNDIATATLPASRVLEENGWYHFSFPAVSDSQGKTFYVQIESPNGSLDNGLSLYWFKPNPLGDPFADGVAYLNGKPTRSDLTFGLGYSASPVEVWSVMLGSAVTNSSQLVLGALLIIAVAGIIWALAWLPPILRDQDRRRRWLSRWSLPFVLGVALVNGLLYMLIVPPWQGPDEYSHFAFAALLDKHNLDSKQVASLSLSGKDRDVALINAINASMDRHDFTRLFAGSAAPGAPSDVGPIYFQQSRQPATYYWLCAVATRVARALGAPANPYTNPEGALMAMRTVSLLLGLIVVALAWLAGALLAPECGIRNSEFGMTEGISQSTCRIPNSEFRNWLRLLLPLTVGLLPMHTFIATVVNNDILAEVAVSALFVSLIALIRWPRGLRGLALAALSVVLALASIPTKSTATAAALPLLAGGLLVWIGTLVLGRRTKDEGRSTVFSARPSSFVLRRWPGVLRLTAGLGAILLVALAFAGAVLLAYRHDDNSAAGWFVSYEPIQRAARVESSTAHQGSYVIELGATAATRQASQNLVPPVYHPAFNVTFSGWARLAPGQTSSAGKVNARLSVMEGAREAGFGEGQPDLAGEWIHLSASGKITASAARVTLSLEAVGQTTEKLQFDDLSLQTSAVGAPWNDPIYKPVLLDPSAEEPPTVLNSVVKQIVPSEINAMADAMANPQPFDKGTLWRDYAGFQYQTFWGSFGWVTINLPSLFYILLGLLALAALAGLAIGSGMGMECGIASVTPHSPFPIPHYKWSCS